MTNYAGVAVIASVLATTTVVGFSLVGQRWTTDVMPVELQLGNAAGLVDGSPDWDACARQSLAAWNAALSSTEMRFTAVRGMSSSPAVAFDGINSIAFAADVFGAPFGPSLVSATQTIAIIRDGFDETIEADVLVNQAQPFNCYRGAMQPGRAVHDLQRTVTHALGHVIGLGHPDAAGQTVAALMNTELGDVDVLQSNDIEGALTLAGMAMFGIPFPPRNEALTFYEGLETEYRDTLQRSQTNESYVDAEGSAVWFPEWLRYVLNGCEATEATTRVLMQIRGQGIQPVCTDVEAGSYVFPPRNLCLDFLKALDAFYRDELGRRVELSHVDLEGKAVWLLEYLRYRVEGDNDTAARTKVLTQIRDAAGGETSGAIVIERVGSVHVMHEPERGRAVFADVMLVEDTRVFVTYQLAGFDAFCEGKSLYFQELDRNLDRVRSETVVIDVDAVGSVFRPTETVAGDLGDHKFVVVNDTFVMLTTLPGEPEARLIRFDTNFEPIDDLTSDSSLARVGDENDGDRLLDMGFETGGGYLYAQFYDQPDGGTVTDWSAQLYQLDMNLSVVAEALVQPEEGTFMTGTSLVWVPAGQMGVSEDRLQSFSPNRDYGNSQRSNIHTFATRAADLTLLADSTKTITDAALDVYFPTGADWNEAHQLWVVGYTQEISEGLHGQQVDGADACDPEAARPANEELREVGPSFISVYDTEWNELQTIQLNNGNPAFRVMLETEGNDIYVAYDEMDLYAWQEISVAKLEQFRILAGS